MKITPEQLTKELARTVDSYLASSIIDCYIDMQQRFLAGDWKPAELDGGRFCEVIARAFLQLDTGRVDHRKLPGKVREALFDKQIPHRMKAKDRHHLTQVIKTVYGFRSDRGAVHISADYTANYADSTLVIHNSKWLLAEFLRLAWTNDENVVAETISQIVQLEHSLIHELDGKPLVLARDIAATEEVLLLLYHAMNNQLSREELRSHASGQTPQNVAVAISRLMKAKEVRTAGDRVALTPVGQKRIVEKILPKLKAHAL